jgi:predicted Zn-dependent protease
VTASRRRYLAALLAPLVGLGGCAFEPFSEPVPVPANYAPPVYSAAQAAPLLTTSDAAGGTGPLTTSTGTTTTRPVIDEATRDQVLAAARAAVARRFTIDPDPKLNEYLVLVGSLVTISTPRPDVEYTYVLLGTEQPVSFAVYPKTICVSRGLLTQMRDESELAGVLGREISNLIAARGLAAAHLPVPAETSAPTTITATRPTTAPAAPEVAPPAPGSVQAARVNKLANVLLDLLVKDEFGNEAQQAADLEGAKFAAAARYAPDGYLRLLTRLKPLSTSTGDGGADASAWERIKTLDAGLQIITRAYPAADARLPARFESYVTPGAAAGRP